MNLNFCVIFKFFSYPDIIKIISFIMILSAFRICHLIFRCIIHLELTFKYSVTEESYYILLLRRTSIFFHSFFPSVQGWNLHALFLFLQQLYQTIQHAGLTYHSLNLISIFIHLLDITKNFQVLESISPPIQTCMLLYSHISILLYIF